MRPKRPLQAAELEGEFTAGDGVIHTIEIIEVDGRYFDKGTGRELRRATMSARKFYIWHDQEAEDEFGWLVGEFPPTEMAYTYDVLEIDIDPTDMDRHAKAQKGQDIFDYLSEQGITYKHMECYSKIYTGTVVYDLVNQEWGLLEDMETTPVATHWDGHNMQFYPFNEGYWSQEIIEVENGATCIDRWDGRNLTTGGSFNHAHVYKSTDGRYVVVLSSQWQGSRTHAAVFNQKEFLEYMKSIDRLEEASMIIDRPLVPEDATGPDKSLLKKIADAQQKREAAFDEKSGHIIKGKKEAAVATERKKGEAER